jgi:hypothetical protein
MLILAALYLPALARAYSRIRGILEGLTDACRIRGGRILYVLFEAEVP